MTAFWNKTTGEKESEATKKSSSAASSKQSTKEKTEKKKADKKKPAGLASPKKAQLVAEVLRGLKMSEDIMRKQELGQYVFVVNKEATKKEIAKAVEAKYGKVVASVNTITYRSRRKNFRGRSGTARGYKKAIVSLKAGQKIETL
jgi:large subunit ribosomal protein L23